jgi:hypothetical protein
MYLAISSVHAYIDSHKATLSIKALIFTRGLPTWIIVIKANGMHFAVAAHFGNVEMATFTAINVSLSALSSQSSSKRLLVTEG